MLGAHFFHIRRPYGSSPYGFAFGRVGNQGRLFWIRNQIFHYEWYARPEIPQHFPREGILLRYVRYYWYFKHQFLKRKLSGSGLHLSSQAKTSTSILQSVPTYSFSFDVIACGHGYFCFPQSVHNHLLVTEWRYFSVLLFICSFIHVTTHRLMYAHLKHCCYWHDAGQWQETWTRNKT